MIYYGKDNGYNLQHWKYISKHKSKNGKWVYEYKTKKEREAEDRAKDFAKVEENAKKINSLKKEDDKLQKEYAERLKTYTKLFKDGIEKGSYTTHDGRFVDNRSGERHLKQASSISDTLKKIRDKRSKLEKEIRTLEDENRKIKNVYAITNAKKEYREWKRSF